MSRPTRRRIVRAVAPVAGLLAAGLLVWQGSYAAFSATTTNANDAWSTGSLALTNNGGGATFANATGTVTGVFSETLIKPGSGNAKCLTVESTGSLPAALKLWRGTFAGTNAANLAAALTVTVDAMTVTPSTNVQANCTGYTGGTAGALYTGTLTGLPTSYAAAAGSMALSGGTERVAYRISWSLPSSVTDNTLQSSSVSTTLTFESQ